MSLFLHLPENYRWIIQRDGFCIGETSSLGLVSVHPATTRERLVAMVCALDAVGKIDWQAGMKSDNSPVYTATLPGKEKTVLQLDHSPMLKKDYLRVDSHHTYVTIYHPSAAISGLFDRVHEGRFKKEKRKPSGVLSPEQARDREIDDNLVWESLLALEVVTKR